MSMLPFFEAMENSGAGRMIRESQWLFPIIEYFHLAAFATIGGAVLIVDLRLLGLLLTSRPVNDLAHDAHPWFVRSLWVMLVSGVLLFTSEAVKCYYSDPFRIKMAALALAIIFTFTVRRKLVRGGTAPMGFAKVKGSAAVSIILWATVAWAGRWIGFSG